MAKYDALVKSLICAESLFEFSTLLRQNHFSWHPDDGLGDQVEYETGKKTFTGKQARDLDAKLETLMSIEKDPYRVIVLANALVDAQVLIDDLLGFLPEGVNEKIDKAVALLRDWRDSGSKDFGKALVAFQTARPMLTEGVSDRIDFMIKKVDARIEDLESIR